MRAARIRDMFAYIDAEDWGSLADLLHPDVVYERPGRDPLVGAPRVLRFYREERAITQGAHDIERVVVRPDAGACWGRFRGVLPDGTTADERFADVYLFRDGTIGMRRTHFFRPAV